MNEDASAIYTTREVAVLLGVSVPRVNQLARERGVGRKLHSRQRVYTQADVEALRHRGPVGRPPAD